MKSLAKTLIFAFIFIGFFQSCEKNESYENTYSIDKEKVEPPKTNGDIDKDKVEPPKGGN